MKPSRYSRLVAPLALAGLVGCSSLQSPGLEVRPIGPEASIGDPYLAGKTALASRRLGNAIEAFREALRRQPDSVPALNGLGVAYDRLGRHDLAQQLYRRALDLEPASVATLNNLGQSLRYQGDIAAASVELRRARELAAPPERAVVETNLSELPSRAAATAPAATAGPPRSLFELERQSVLTVMLKHRQASPPRQEPAMRLRLEIANGAGRTGMAARMRRYLASRGVGGAHLTNARPFDQQETLIVYRPGFDQAAARLAALVPLQVRLVEDAEQRAEIRLLLGHDFLALDSRLGVPGPTG